MLENPEIRFLPLDARRVAYEKRGDGPPLVAPAWWVSHLELDWQSIGFRRFWEGVADGYTLIRYDRLGVGMSDRTVRESDLTIEGEVATLRALLDELDLERVTLLGGSCGSCTAIAFAATYPERVERLVLYGSYPDGAEVTPPGVGDAIIGAVRAHWGLGARVLSDIFLGPPIPQRTKLRAAAAGGGERRRRGCVTGSRLSPRRPRMPSPRPRADDGGAPSRRPRRTVSVGTRGRSLDSAARRSFRCRGVRTSPGTAMSTQPCVRAGNRWGRGHRRRTARASRNRSCYPSASGRSWLAWHRVSAIARSPSSWC